MVCVTCETQKTRIYDGKKRSDGRKLYHDHTGREWAGKKCPDCRYGGTVIELKKLSNRPCRSCKKALPEERYFNCLDCVPILEEDMGDEMYCA